jgi:nitrate/nitrite transporter NarK
MELTGEQVITLLATGNAAFTSSSFWLCLYLQRTQRLSALWIAVYLLPQNINGLIINFVCSLILHRVPHRVLMGVGALAYLVSFLLLALLQPIRYYYWAFVFPSLLLAVVGADLQFNVANVRHLFPPTSVLSSLDEPVSIGKRN